jgi:iron complex outermembrane recepter protein
MGGRVARGRASLLALASAMAANPAAAQQADEQPGTAADGETSEEQPASMAPPEGGEPAQEITRTIVVTGSRIPRPNLTAVSPVTVIGDEEVKLEGAIMAEELLNQLPQVAPSQGSFISNGATGTATVDLRNLGPARTLVLINGRRLGPGDPTSPVADLNVIPTSLIQRVEVLTGGASSVYGSDAVSGVINFILETRLNGLRVDGQASVFQHDNRNGSGLVEALEARGFPYPSGNSVDGGRQDINLAYGKSFLDGRAHATVYAGYRKLTEVRQDARDYSACAAQAL